VFGVDRVEVGWIVISEVHVDHDPVELAEPGHPHNLRLRSGLTEERVCLWVG
jgi:hypothetical protein